MIRNGVETSPLILRNKKGVDKMPIRRKLKTKYRFGSKVCDNVEKTDEEIEKMFMKNREQCIRI